MNRRDLFRCLSLAGATALCGCSGIHLRRLVGLAVGPAQKETHESPDIAEIRPSSTLSKQPHEPKAVTEDILKDVRSKSRYFEQDFPDDIWFTGRKLELVQNLVSKFRAVQRHTGHGNFNVIGMDEFFRLAKLASGAGEVTAEEKLFLEEVFYFDAKQYGFQGEKVVQRMTDAIDKTSLVKVPNTGHFLRKGLPVETYEKIRRDVGDSIFLTSGVRAIAKQYHLFFEKGLETKGNMSKASRSLAPPGHSFHGHGDFDVGKRGLGTKNFTEEFALCEEYKKLLDLGYVQIRYTESNLLGVRFEPWHIKVQSGT